MKQIEHGNEWTKVSRISLMAALKTHCLKTNSQELCIWASVHMYTLSGAGIISHRSDLHLVYNFACNLNNTATINTLLF